MEHKQIILNALNAAKGDDLERMEACCGDASEEELANTQFGKSGKTFLQILNGYREHREKIEKAIEWVEENLK